MCASSWNSIPWLTLFATIADDAGFDDIPVELALGGGAGGPLDGAEVFRFFLFLWSDEAVVLPKVI